MKIQNRTPETLSEAIQYFADPDRALYFVASLRWPAGITCTHCESREVGFLKTRRIFKCRTCHRQFSVKIGTIFEDSPLGLDKWLPAMWLIANCKNGVSSYEVARALGVTQKTAWFMLHRIRLAMQTPSFGKMGGDVEVDETFIGGRGRFMHAHKKIGKIKGGGVVGKAVVIGMLQRHPERGKSQVKARVIRNIRRRFLQPEVRREVIPGSNVYTDALASYEGLHPEYAHQVIDHAECYVKGKIHTNGLENFWSLLKRSIKGTYVSVEPFHLFRYLDEQCFRFNLRRDNDHGRFVEALRYIVGRRLTYRGLIGNPLPQTC